MKENSIMAAQLAAQIVGSYIGKNPIQPSDVPNFYRDVFKQVETCMSGEDEIKVTPKPDLVPAVNPKKSITPDYIICLEDGKRFKSLKRHLNVHFQMSPDEYRAKWGLPADYPMVAPNYAKARSELAKEMGLGRKA